MNLHRNLNTTAQYNDAWEVARTESLKNIDNPMADLIAWRGEEVKPR